MSEYKKKSLPIADGTAFIKMLEQAVEDGNPDLIAANLPSSKGISACTKIGFTNSPRFSNEQGLLSSSMNPVLKIE
jgi:hypothetical protein